MRFSLALALVLAGFMLGRVSTGWSAQAVGNALGGSPTVSASASTAGVSILDLAEPGAGRPRSVAEQAAEALRRNEGGLDARQLRERASKPGASPALVKRADEAERAGRAASEAEARRLEGAR